MYKKGRFGFTLIELLAVIIILAIVILITIPTILNIIEDAKKGAFKNSAYRIIKTAEYNYSKRMVKKEDISEIIYTYNNGIEVSNPNGYKLDYKGLKPKNGTVIIDKDGKVSIAIHDGTFCAQKDFQDSEVKLSKIEFNECTILSDIVDNYNEVKGVNKPQIVLGMTPIKWNGTTWIDTTEDDPDWYDYSTKKWANVKTADGSFWVWIPRYAYSITSGYHTSTVSTIEIKFLKNKTNISSDGTAISILPTYGESGQTNYVLHPAFKFGEDEISGFWVAKFEPSGTASNINILPNVSSLRSMKIGDQFNAAFNMRNNSKYGWGSDEVETRMMKNSDWGAIVYLSNSIYGANSEIWINNSSGYITGCAGSSASASSISGCPNAYNTTNGQKASTTHNVYGIYDMSGGALERTSSYVDNGSSYLTTYGKNILDNLSKYKNVYEAGTTDVGSDHYIANNNTFGDAIYETSAAGSGSTSWYKDYSYMPATIKPWFDRGGSQISGTNAGVFYFNGTYGTSDTFATFRPVVVIP